MFELDDGGKDLVLKILDLFLLSSELLKFKVRDLLEKNRRDPVGKERKKMYLPHSPSCGGVSSSWLPSPAGVACRCRNS